MAADFGDPDSERLAASQSSVIADLSHLAVVEVSGSDAGTFLQGQLTCDVLAITPGQGSLGAYCTAKGRMLADFLMARSGAGFLLLLPRSLEPAFRKRLQMFVLRAKVSLADASDKFVVLGISGREAQTAWAAVASNAKSGSVAVHLPHERTVIAVPNEHAPAVWEALTARLRPVGAACWRWLDIVNGVPIIVPATQDKLVPQMANLDALGAVSFNKGCYTGQEIIARTHYLGKVKRRMYPAHLSAVDKPPEPGDELFSDDLGDQASGLVVDAAPSPNGGHDLLAVVQANSKGNSTVHLRSPAGPTLEFLPLPYELPEP